MKKSTITIKGKDSLGREFAIPADYEEPENFKEAIRMDGETKAFKIFLNERKTSYMDKLRGKEKTKRDEALKSALNDPARAAQIQAILDA